MGLSRRFERLPLFEDRRVLGYATALGFSGIAWALRSVLDPDLPPGFPYVTFFPAVILASFLFGRGPGILAGIACGFLSWYFFLPPAFSLALDGNTALALLFYVAVVSVDIAIIHWMQRANRRAIDEREMSRELAIERGRLVDRTELLFSELQHRVSNNLQMIGAVLSLQMRDIDDLAARRTLSEAINKLQLIGRIQRQLYDTTGEQVSVDVLMAELAADLIAAGGKPGVVYTIDVTPGMRLPPESAIPLALIMAESIANAIEHGFADRDSGSIVISLKRRDDRVCLTIRDDGIGLPGDFDLDRTTSLGLKVARTLATQLGATYLIEGASPGTTVQLSFPAA
ncbi:MAG: histidine kinase [Sphingomonas sp. 28-66-16]|nr:MAG: histidine kinase [Sphingomonas sp. 28-66-16]